MTSALDELAAVYGADQRSAEVHDSRGRLAIKDRKFIRGKEPLEAVVEADQFPSEFFGGTTGSAKHGIEPRAIPAARENPDAFAIHRGGTQSVDPFLVGRPSEAQVS